MDVQKAMLNASVAFELHANGSRSNWSLSNGGLRRINDCFFFLSNQEIVADKFLALATRRRRS
jgi:hypothetical protein